MWGSWLACVGREKLPPCVSGNLVTARRAKSGGANWFSLSRLPVCASKREGTRGFFFPIRGGVRCAFALGNSSAAYGPEKVRYGAKLASLRVSALVSTSKLPNVGRLPRVLAKELLFPSRGRRHIVKRLIVSRRERARLTELLFSMWQKPPLAPSPKSWKRGGREGKRQKGKEKERKRLYYHQVSPFSFGPSKRRWLMVHIVY